MKKVFALIIFLVLNSCVVKKVSSDLLLNETIISLNNGSVVEGRVSLPIKAEDKKVSIKVGNKVKKIASKEIRSINIKTSSSTSLVYDNVTVYDNQNKSISNKKILLQKLISEEEITLYQGYETKTVNVYGKPYIENVDMFYCRRNNESAASNIYKGFRNNKKKGTNRFKKNASKYFSDEPSIVEKIENNTYTHHTIIQMVGEYIAIKRN